jgi:hypothetical protein
MSRIGAAQRCAAPRLFDFVRSEKDFTEMKNGDIIYSTGKPNGCFLNENKAA